MNLHASTAYGALLLRVALGVMFLAHSVVLKLMTFTLAGTAQFFVSLGLPAWFAYATFLAETVGGVLLALALSPILLGAVWVHSGNGWVFSSDNGGWEYPAFLLLLCFIQALLGDGAYALSRSRLPARRAYARA